MNLPTDPKERKNTPIYSGVVKYFPLALAEVARVSKAGNDQHNGVGSDLHWDKSKSTDHADCIIRHLIEAGTLDSDGQRHSAKVAWRALAALEIELESSLIPQTIEKCNCCGKGIGGRCGACHCQMNRIKHDTEEGTLIEYGAECCPHKSWDQYMRVHGEDEYKTQGAL